MNIRYDLFLLALFKKLVLRQNTGRVIKDFCTKQGTVYIKVAQMLSTQNFGDIFTENDRQELAGICDEIKEISFEEIEKVLEKEYNGKTKEIFLYIDPNPIGSASISQVHRAVLKSGEIVAVKVKRNDVTKNIENDIESFRKLMYRGGRLIGFQNMAGGSKGLDLYLKWIHDETDFEKEKNNIIRYKEFADSVNGKVKGAKDIEVPGVYENLCTPNIIVMDFIESKTIRKMQMNTENKEKIKTAMNSYLQLSFYALFNNKPVVFHGDPHSGNIYITQNGNIGFLDMGLIFELGAEEAEVMKETFSAIYLNDLERMYNALVVYGNFDSDEKESFKNDLFKHFKDADNIPLTSYYTEMIAICTKHNIVPADYFYAMAKAFVCISGINGFTENMALAKEILKEQAIEFFIKKTFSESVSLVKEGMKVIHNTASKTIQEGIPSGISALLIETEKLSANFNKFLNEITPIINEVTPEILNSVSKSKYTQKEKIL